MIRYLAAVQIASEKRAREEYANAEWFPYFTYKPVRLGTQRTHRLSRIRPSGAWRWLCTIEVAVTTTRLYFRDPLTDHSRSDMEKRANLIVNLAFVAFLLWVLS